MQAIQKATLTQTEVKKYLGIGHTVFKRLMADEEFPKPKPIIEKWAKAEIDHWLILSGNTEKSKEPEDWRDFIGV